MPHLPERQHTWRQLLQVLRDFLGRSSRCGRLSKLRARVSNWRQVLRKLRYRAGRGLSELLTGVCGSRPILPMVYAASRRPPGVKAAGIGQRVAAYLLDILLFFATLIIGYIIWWLFTLSRGQMPGKRLVGIRVMRTDGTASDWGWTFIREFLVKFALFEVAADFVRFGLASILDLLWAFWDRDSQTLHDKIVNTVVVDDCVFLSEARGASPVTA